MFEGRYKEEVGVVFTMDNDLPWRNHNINVLDRHSVIFRTIPYRC